MIFTDEDLKRMYDLNSDGMKNSILSLYVNSDICALLARLEAAEAYIQSMPENVTDNNHRLYRAWGEAMGK